MPRREEYQRNRQRFIDEVLAWKHANPEKARANGRKYQAKLRSTEAGRKHSNQIARTYRERHPEKVRAAFAKWIAEHPEYNREYIARRAKENPELYLFNQAKRRAARLGLEFSLTLDDIFIPDNCPVLGIPLEVMSGKRGRANYSPSLDRFDNSKGYIKGNVVVISMRANWLKSDATLDELKNVVAYMELRGLK